jgi:hypothetical protein
MFVVETGVVRRPVGAESARTKVAGTVADIGERSPFVSAAWTA